jgi:hypothetical protein
MLTHRREIQLAQEVERARADSLELWQKVVALQENFLLNDTVARFPDSVKGLPLNLKGRYQVGDGNEFDCEIRKISPFGIDLRGPKEGRLGKGCAANIASVGIVEGIVVQAAGLSLTVGIIAFPSRIQRLARRLRWQMRRTMDQLRERRASERIEMNRATALLKTLDNRIFPCEVFDISEGGVAVHLGANALYFWVDQPVMFEDRAAHVLRSFPGGIVITFDNMAPGD